MASHSSKPNSHKHPKEDSKTPDASEPNSSDKLTDDLDFWSMDSDVEESDITDEALDETEAFLNSPVLPIGKTKTLSEISETPAELRDLDDGEIIEKLAKANSREEISTIRTLSDEDLEEYQNVEHEEELEVVKQKRERKEKTKKRSPLELAGTIACVLFILGFGIYFYNYYNDKFDVLTDDEWASNIPVEGEYANIKSVQTWWSEPVTKAKLGVKLVPCLTITLDEEAKSGALRVIFFSYEEGLNGNKRAKGDPFPLEFRDGKFSNGKSSITIQGTDGFESRAEFYAYRSQMENRWTVSIKEGPSIGTRSADFQDLGHAPIDPIQRSLETAK